MLNKALLMGRLTAVPEAQRTTQGTSVISFCIAVERKYRNSESERMTDFIQCVAWRNTADYIEKYYNKGQLICIEGNIQTRSYTDGEGVKRYITEVIVEQVHPTGERKGVKETEETSDGFEEVTNFDDDSPFFVN